MSLSSLPANLEDLETSVRNTVRAALGASGLVSLVIGVAVLLAPVKTAAVVAGFVAAYGVLAGLANLAVAVFSRKVGPWPRVGYGLLGAVFLLAGVLAFSNLQATALTLGMLISILFGLAWILEGVVGLVLLGDAASKGWTILTSAVGILAGVMLVTSPLWGASLLWLLLGVSLVVIGVGQLVRAFRFGRS